MVVSLAHRRNYQISTFYHVLSSADVMQTSRRKNISRNWKLLIDNSDPIRHISVPSFGSHERHFDIACVAAQEDCAASNLVMLIGYASAELRVLARIFTGVVVFIVV